MRIHVAYADYVDEWNTSIWRCIIPANALERVGHDVSVSHYVDILKYDAEVYLIERNLQDSRLAESCSRLRKAGKRIVVTFDDSYSLMPDYIPTKHSWGQDEIARFNRGLRLADAAIVPSKLLADDYRRYCKDIRYIPNYCDTSLYSAHHTPIDHFRILFGVNNTHLHSVKESGLLGALEKLCTRHPVEVIMVSSDPMCHLAFQEAIPQGRLRTMGWMPLAKWATFIAEADAIVCPLSGEYDRRRSWVKAIDSLTYGIPMIASDMEPFRETGALLVGNNEKSWYQALSDVVLSPMVRNRIVKRMKATLGDVSIDAHIKEYEDVLCNYQSTPS